MRVPIKRLAGKRNALYRGLDIADIAGLPMAGAMKCHSEIKWVARSGVEGADGIGNAANIRGLAGVSLFGRLCGPSTKCRKPYETQRKREPW